MRAWERRGLHTVPAFPATLRSAQHLLTQRLLQHEPDSDTQPPLRPADLIGLDTCLAVMRELHGGLGDSKYRCAGGVGMG